MAAKMGLGEGSVLAIKIVYLNPEVIFKEWIWTYSSEFDMTSTEVALQTPGMWKLTSKIHKKQHIV